MELGHLHLFIHRILLETELEIASARLPRKDNGKVTLENTKLGAMNDHITLPAIHPFYDRRINKLSIHVLHFLKAGSFKREN